MFADDIILYVENTGDDTHTHKIRINKFSKKLQNTKISHVFIS